MIRAIIVACFLCACFTVAFAQDAKPTRIVLTLNDGKTVSGELVEATPAGVTLKPNPKAEPVMTPWSSIKRAGGGLSREAIVNEWRKSKPQLLCDTCTGAGATTCPTCEGTGVDPAQKQTCAKCEGSGSTGKCKTPNCVDGKIPCPDKCLKAESFTGPKDADGKRWRQFKGKGGGSLRVSDGHIGQRVLMVDGVPQLIQEPCPTCAGITRVKDAACKGTGKTLCADCKGHGVVGPDCTACEGGSVKCETCGGSGLKAVSSTNAPTPASDK
jgi:hypothetical protein